MLLIRALSGLMKLCLNSKTVLKVRSKDNSRTVLLLELYHVSRLWTHCIPDKTDWILVGVCRSTIHGPIKHYQYCNSHLSHHISQQGNHCLIKKQNNFLYFFFFFNTNVSVQIFTQWLKHKQTTDKINNNWFLYGQFASKN